jgi:hypothetical protein
VASGAGVRGTGDRQEEECSLDQLLALGSGAAFYEYDYSCRKPIAFGRSGSNPDDAP